MMNVMKKNAKWILVAVLLIAVVVYFLVMNKKGSSVAGTKKQLVFFHMDGCGHCESMKPEWKKLSEMGEYKGVTKKLVQDTWPNLIKE